MFKSLIRLATLFALAVATGAAIAATVPVTLSGTVTNSQLSTVPSARLVWTVMNCATSPQVDGVDIASPFLVTAGSNGTLSGTVHGSPDISCGSTAYYQISAYTNSGIQLWTRNYQTSGTSFNISTAVQMSALPAPPNSAGTQGQAGTIAIGTVTGLSTGSNPTVTNSGTSSAALLNFGIPAGATGATGPTGPSGSDGTSFPGADQVTSILGDGSEINAAKGSFISQNLRMTDSAGNDVDANLAVSAVARNNTANTYTALQTFQNTSDSVTLGPELISATGWVVGSGWTGTFATGFTATPGAGTLTFPVATLVGSEYVASITITDPNPDPESKVCVTLGGSIGAHVSCPSGLTTPTVTVVGYIPVNTNGNLVLSPSSTFGGTITVTSLKTVSLIRGATFNVKDTTGSVVYEARIGPSGTANIFMGNHSGMHISKFVSSDTSFGDNSLANEFMGVQNTAIGAGNLSNLWGGVNNTSVGVGTMANATIANANTVVGEGALLACTACQSNVVLGIAGGGNITFGQANTIIGSYAAESITTGSSNIVIGGVPQFASLIDVPTPTTSNYLNIGNAISGTGISNAIFGGAIGIGKQIASYSLDVNGSIRSTGLTDPAGAPTVVPNTPGSTTYSYSVVAYLQDGTHTIATPVTTITNGSASLTLTNFNTISWSAVPSASYYQIYMTAPSVQLVVPNQASGAKTVGTSTMDVGHYSTGTAPTTNNTWGLILAGNQALTGVQGTGSNIATTTGSFTAGDLIKVASDGTFIDSGSGPNTSTATIASVGATGITATCDGTCTSQHGLIKLVAVSSSTIGGVATISFGTSDLMSPHCLAVQNSTTNGNTTYYGLGASTILTSGFSILNTTALASDTVEVDYSCSE